VDVGVGIGAGKTAIVGDDGNGSRARTRACWVAICGEYMASRFRFTSSIQASGAYPIAAFTAGIS
jgi:hypothetical protein